MLQKLFKIFKSFYFVCDHFGLFVCLSLLLVLLFKLDNCSSHFQHTRVVDVVVLRRKSSCYHFYDVIIMSQCAKKREFFSRFFSIKILITVSQKINDSYFLILITVIIICVCVQRVYHPVANKTQFMCKPVTTYTLFTNE